MKGELGWQLTHLRSPKSHLMEQGNIVFQDEEILLAFPWDVWLMLWHSGGGDSGEGCCRHAARLGSFTSSDTPLS